MTGAGENDRATPVVQADAMTRTLADLQASIATLRRQRLRCLGRTIAQQDLEQYVRLERAEKTQMRARRTLLQSLLLGQPFSSLQPAATCRPINKSQV